MNNFEKTITELQKFIHLSPDEKELLRSRISQRMATTPATPSPYLRVIQKSHFVIRRIALAAIVLMLTGGAGFVAASENSLPGSALYAFKTSVLEELISNLKSSPEAKIAYEIDRTERRYKELSRLAEGGNLDADKADMVIKNIQKHTDTATRQAQEVAFTEPDKHHEITEDIKASLENKKESLANIQASQSQDSQTNNDAQNEINELVALTDKKVAEITKIQETIAEVTAEDPTTVNEGIAAEVIEQSINDLLIQQETLATFLEIDLPIVSEEIQQSEDTPLTETVIQHTTDITDIPRFVELTEEIEVQLELAMAAFESTSLKAAENLINKIRLNTEDAFLLITESEETFTKEIPTDEEITETDTDNNTTETAEDETSSELSSDDNTEETRDQNTTSTGTTSTPKPVRMTPTTTSNISASSI